MTHKTIEERVMTKKRSSDFWSRKVHPPEKILATPTTGGVHGNGNSYGNPTEMGVAFWLLMGLGIMRYVYKKFLFCMATCSDR